MLRPLLFTGRFISLLLCCPFLLQAQPAGAPLGSGPWVLQSLEQDYVRVSVLARTLDHPFGLVFIPATASVEFPLGTVLITERTGKVRLFRNGRLEEAPLADLTESFPLEQLFDIELHPDFTDNRLVYFTYIRTAPHPDGGDGYWVTTALARGRFDGESLSDLEDVFIADAWSDNFGGASSRLHFLEDGTVLFGVSHRLEREAPQSYTSHIGKVLRLNDDGTVPADNPLVNVEGAAPEIYTLGNRSVMDFASHPDSGEIWELENGPQGGDEVNILRPSSNYGWPLATFGRDYDGTRFGPRPWVEGSVQPELFWVPSVTVAGMDFYTGSAFPGWQGNLFVASMIMGRIAGTGHLQRIVFNENGEIRREALLRELHQRIRYVVQGPDELLYLLTDHPDGALLRMEPGSQADMLSLSGALPDTGAQEDILFSNGDCRSCHRIGSDLVGPSYTRIAARYPNSEASMTLLAERIISGSEGAWGESPMTPHPDLTMREARDMVRRILELGAD